MTLRLRVTLGLLVVVVAAFAFLLDWLVADLKPSHRRSTEEPLVDTAHVLAALAAENVRDGHLDISTLDKAFRAVASERFSASIYGNEKTGVDLVMYMTDRAGRVVYDSRGGRDVGRDYSTKNDVLLTLAGKYGSRTTHDDPAAPETSVMYVAAPIRAGGALAGVLALGKPSRTVNLAVAQARERIVWVGVATAASIVLLGLMVTSFATVPLVRQTREALEGKKYIENYVQTLTHEMKSPLAALIGAAELLDEDMPPERRRQFLANIRVESARLTDLVEKMLMLSSLEQRNAPEQVEELDAAALAREVRASLAPVAEARGLMLEVAAGGAAPFRGERFLVRHALANLVQNALEFAPRGTAVRVLVEARADGVTLAVEDAGPGVPAYALPRVFERFYSLERPDTGRKSSGLGLALVREVAQLHRGAASLENRPGGGARAELRFPRA